ncbi:hypothetical protein [Streptacidiphilus fuscans]|uniref:Uncharacterized protein n=1 Tax=Streptacidiphilus fuscans TaxID=2789292 RepID=A0A931AZ87_9ACTN|nr:hypothetical protein [Streptacidiphilus fuscans]MBF9068174.1 hypothetical protein [Streptacidiphilus fuscans]
MNNTDSPSARAAALDALKDWADRRANMEPERQQLVVNAWNVGARTIAELARAAGVTRDTVYSDLRAAGIDYSNKDYDPRLTRLVKAVAQMAMAFNPDTKIGVQTRADYGPAMAEAAALLVHFQGPDLVGAVGRVLSLSPHGPEDQAMLKPQIDELAAAYSAYLNPLTAPIQRVMRRPAAQ